MAEKKTEPVKYWSPKNILKTKADYMVIYGERSNGKTTGVQLYALEDFVKSGYKNQLAIIRRMEEDFKGKNLKNMFSDVVLWKAQEWTKGRYNNIVYRTGAWYLVHTKQNGDIDSFEETPFAYAFAISSEEHYKSTSYPKVKNILFDEFITRTYYLPNEFIEFENLLSTIIRLKTDVKIFMCGNTINKYCPYFSEMGLTGVRKQKKGTIDLYNYGESDLLVAVEYSDFPSKKKPSNKYFAFDNPKLHMITEGGWEISVYPHLPCKYNPPDVKYKYFIKFDSDLLQCEVIHRERKWFTYIHRKTTPVKDNPKEIVFDTEIHAEPRYRRRLNRPSDDYGSVLWSFFVTDKVFYQDNEVGEIVRNYLAWCNNGDE